MAGEKTGVTNQVEHHDKYFQVGITRGLQKKEVGVYYTASLF